MNPTLRPNTQKILECIISFKKVNDCTPTLRQIAQQCYIAQSAVQRHMEVLESHGIIERVPIDAQTRIRYRLSKGYQRG